MDDHGLGLRHAAGARVALDHLGTVLKVGEKALCGATGFLEGRPGLVVATTQRLLFVYRDETPIDDSYSDISAFRAVAGMLTADLEISDKAGRAVIKQIHPRTRLVEFASILQRGPSEVAAPVLPGTHPGSEPGESEWRPKLRPKISPLAPRSIPTAARTTETVTSVPPLPSVPSVASPVALEPTSLDPTPTPQPMPTLRPAPAGPAQDGWRPHLGDPLSPGRGAPTVPLGVPSRPGPMLGSRAAPFAPRPLPSSRWLQAGEWQVSAYAEVLALLTGGDQMVTVSITNRRVLALNSSGELVGERPLSGVEAEETSARTAQLSEGFAFEFPTPESAREFAKAVVTAGLLMPLPRAGYAGPAQESGN